MATIGLLGTLHNDEIRKEVNFPLSLMEEKIFQFAPDIICGEIREQDWSQYKKDKSYKGYLGPDEYRRLIIPLCEQAHIKFFPIDFFEEDHVTLDHFAPYSEEEQGELIFILSEKYEKMFEETKTDLIPFNSHQLNRLIEDKQEWLRKVNPDVQQVIWDYRNKVMIDNINKIVKKNKGKRILVTVGAEHCYIFLKAFHDEGLKVEFPLLG
ncbi:TraB/GumN family protein [Chengkuizengella sediminis]|uniref:TraB/GumN family protein n=1 Tax=Chengkuizengella sediminis TaxID=1885917 RepID=UPI00138A06EB|nr:TraB/GumN family protein [Chengkuizengella sediminis]NDI35052.1 TraB/GumN family protein [Chengkuizengella sediminis]